MSSPGGPARTTPFDPHCRGHCSLDADAREGMAPQWRTGDIVRRAVDKNSSPGRFPLAGSASPQTPPTHSGAGRIVDLRMRPATLAERGIVPSVSLAALLAGGRPAISGATTVGLEEYVEQIIGSGLPAVLGRTDAARRALLDAYLDRIVDRDFPEAGLQVRNPAGLRRWLAAYAAATATTATFETIRDAATAGQSTKPARTTTTPYRDTLERIWVSDPVPGWSPTPRTSSPAPA